ncbi:uncharacterized protein Z519_06005 [Cladophialophora bantiana CBS 173.52]|uniref:Cupin type-2 domain-containing protein n=1 Tax=Cladophialophora bantiana (strain ATCC 10958 / CBS 173.52 / CDC B-1940 / NIH 8579) TaxID=1442370 RepID=A0A0D2HRD2_CLAB1|nr:uncharacterized protein Z519_06005 [Cladophialophora bantiana CBS 173.52]KIW93400.1 hypothetical protein Z519_06005 [Cladophialophora bantiana CBS 173.52]
MATNNVSHPPNLRTPTTFVTTHDVQGVSIVHTASPATFQDIGPETRFNVIYTTSEMPVNMNGDQDISVHQSVMSSGKLGLVRPHGTVCRMVDFAPGSEGIMHRTKSLDYGVVVEGEVNMLLDSGEVQLMKRGDVAVQRGTMHAWKNPSKTEWARMVFVLQDSQALNLGDDVLGEDLGHGKGDIPASGNE